MMFSGSAGADRAVEGGSEVKRVRVGFDWRPAGRCAPMQRAPIPEPPRVVGGMLGREEVLGCQKLPKKGSFKLAKTLSRSPSPKPNTPAGQSTPPPMRSLSDPPVMSYQDMNTFANGL